MIVNDIGLTKDSYSNIYTTDGSEIGTIYDQEGHVIYYMYRDTIGDGSRVFISYGAPIKDYKIYGETIQNGTPSPDYPVDVVGCGVRTENLANLYGVNKTGLNLTFTTGNNMTIKINGTKIDGTNVRVMTNPNIVLPAGTYTVKIKMIGGSITNITGGVMFGINESTYGMRTAPQVNAVGQIGTRTFTLNADTLLTSLDITPSYGDTGAVFTDAEFECWFYAGSDDKPYEPYGYKLPLTVNGTEYPIYLGEAQTTRRIKKLVLTGEEGGTWSYNVTIRNGNGFYNPTIFTGYKPHTGVGYCTHYPLSTATTDTIGVLFGGNINFITDFAEGIDTVDKWKAYLAAQYVNGTPVTVWYILAEPETGIVNEPLHKIGDYADTISFAQAGATIPTFAGTNTLTIDTPVKPSEIDLTGRLKTSGYGQLLDKNLTAINDSTGTPIFIR